MPRFKTHPSVASRLEAIKLEQEEAKLAILKSKVPESRDLEHTPYDEIPPPNDAEMRIIQDRLYSTHERILAALERDEYDQLMRWSKSPYSP